MLRVSRHGCLLALGAALVMAGCSPWSTYPPVETRAAQALSRPTFEPVPTVMALAIDYARTEYLPGKDLAINLPQGANWEVYQRVFGKLEGGGRPLIDDKEPAIHIKEVRTRSFDAQVDLIYPRGDGLNQLATISMHSEVFKDWRVTSARLWQIRDVQTPEPHYIPPTPEELAKKKIERGPAGETPASKPAG